MENGFVIFLFLSLSLSATEYRKSSGKAMSPCRLGEEGLCFSFRQTPGNLSASLSVRPSVLLLHDRNA